jgi:transposase, IS6 family
VRALVPALQAGFRDLVEMMAKRGLLLSHTTIMRWVKRFTPEFVKCRVRLARSAGRSWRVDETYVKIRGKWGYLYRAVDRAGNTVDVRLSITLDGYAASHRAVREMKTDELLPGGTTLRSSKYLNNLIEQDYRNIKSRINAMPGFKRFRNAGYDLRNRTDASHSKRSI